MCGRYVLASPPEELAQHFQLDQVPQLPFRYNIAPTQPVPIVRFGGGKPDNGARELMMVRWGLVPFWADDPKIGNRMINARSETASDKPAFRAAFKRRRCLIPSTGFYEWKKTGDGKQPYYIHRKDESVFGLAGLWEHWQGDDGSELYSCTILTTQPNDVVRPLHNRMPVILEPTSYETWLNPAIKDKEQLNSLLEPSEVPDLEAYPVTKHVNSPANDDPTCIERQ